MKQLILLLSFVTTLTFVNAQNQEVIGSAGDYNTTNDVQVSWTVGEASTETYSNTNNTVTQGFHQTKLTVTQIKEKLVKNNNFSLKVYPNPTVDYVNIEITTESTKELSYELNDNAGKLLLKSKFNDKFEKIDFGIYQPSIYYLRVYSNDGSFTDTYRIIKDRK